MCVRTQHLCFSFFFPAGSPSGVVVETKIEDGSNGLERSSTMEEASPFCVHKCWLMCLCPTVNRRKTGGRHSCPTMGEKEDGVAVECSGENQMNWESSPGLVEKFKVLLFLRWRQDTWLIFFFFLNYNIKTADLIWTPCWRNGNKSDRMRRNEADRFLLLVNVQNGRLQVLMRFGKEEKRILWWKELTTCSIMPRSTRKKKKKSVPPTDNAVPASNYDPLGSLFVFVGQNEKEMCTTHT